MPAAPTTFGPDRLKADIEADFAVRGIAGVTVLVGEWETEKHYGTPRVIIGLGKGSIEDPAGTRFGANGWIDVGNSQVARALLADVQTFPIWIHSIAPPNTAPASVAQAARDATQALKQQTAAAIRRTRGGLPLMPWAVEWLNEARGEFVYGTVLRLEVPIALFVPDDPSDTGEADESEIDGQADVDGVLTPATPESSTDEGS